MKHDAVFERIEASFRKQGFLKLIGACLEHAERGKVVLSCAHKDVLTQQQGLMHGGVVASLADVACGYAALTTMPEDKEVLSVEFKLNMLRPAAMGTITATGRVIQTGRTLVISEAEVVGEDGKLIAKMLGTMIVTAKEDQG